MTPDLKTIADLRPESGPSAIRRVRSQLTQLGRRPNAAPPLFAAALFITLLASSGNVASQDRAQLRACSKLIDRNERLACFDALVEEAEPGPAASAERPSSTDVVPAGEPESGSRLSKQWELGPSDERAPLAFRPHRENYVLFANYSRHPNFAPYRPFRVLEPEANISHTELAFQLGFKMKLLQNAFATPVDLWFGYTQRSFWQAYNRKASNPFRESNYEPELMAVLPLDAQLLGWRLRFVNLAVNHQSNGQSLTLSRGWNRIYGQVGLERGDFTLLARLWKPFGDRRDNPDIIDFMGHGDLVASYRWRGQELALAVRRNLRTHHGALQAAWSFPLAGELSGYVQLFSGYGDSLINYNARQETLGVGVRVGF